MFFYTLVPYLASTICPTTPTVTSLMSEEPYDTYIDFGFDDEANTFASPADPQNIPPFLLEILAALGSGFPSSQIEGPATVSTFPSPPTALSVPPAQPFSPFYHPFPTPSSSLGTWSALSGYHPAACVRPSDTIRIHGAPYAALGPPALSSHGRVTPTLLRHSPTKRPREEMENSGHPERSSPQKRLRAAPPRTTRAPDVEHTLNFIDNHSPIPHFVDEGVCAVSDWCPPAQTTSCTVATREPTVSSMDWGILPGPGNNSNAGPSTVDIENVHCLRTLRKRTRNDGKSDASASSNKRRKKVALADAPAVLNAPVAPYLHLHSTEQGEYPLPCIISHRRLMLFY